MLSFQSKGVWDQWVFDSAKLHHSIGWSLYKNKQTLTFLLYPKIEPLWSVNEKRKTMTKQHARKLINSKYNATPCCTDWGPTVGPFQISSHPWIWAKWVGAVWLAGQHTKLNRNDSKRFKLLKPSKPVIQDLVVMNCCMNQLNHQFMCRFLYVIFI